MSARVAAGLVLLACALTAPAAAWAQDGGGVASDGALPPGHPSLPPVDPDAALPPGHPSVEDPHGGSMGMHAARIPQSEAAEAAELPPGVIEVRVVDASGAPVGGASVRIGSMREGERGAAQVVQTDPGGLARVLGLETGTNVAYRVSTELAGAKYGAPPFQLPTNAGYRVRLVRFEVEPTPRAVLIWDARFEMHFKDDRLVVVERLSLVNLSGMSLGRETPRPATWVPVEGVRFRLPRGYTAFNVAPSMADVRVTDEGGAAVLRGSLPPTGTEPLEVAFQYQLKLDGGEVELSAGLPLPVVGCTVVTEAPPGLTLAVDGMSPAEARDSRGQHVLLTGVERRPSDPPLEDVRIHLGGIPAAAGGERWGAAGAAAALVLGSVGFAVTRRGGGRSKRAREQIVAERDRVLAEAAELLRAHRAGEVGPATYERRRRELSVWLAALLRELDEG